MSLGGVNRHARAAVVLLLGLLLLAGCSASRDRGSPSTAAPAGPTIDYSSEQSYETSLAAVKATVDEATQKELDISLTAIWLAMDGDKSKVQKVVHGKTARQVIDFANDLE